MSDRTEQLLADILEVLRFPYAVSWTQWFGRR
jgi:hypothetical protein